MFPRILIAKHSEFTTRRVLACNPTEAVEVQ